MLIQGTSSTLDGGEEEVYLVHLNGLTDRDVAAKLRGHQVFVRDDERKQKVPTLALTLPRSYDRSTTFCFNFLLVTPTLAVVQPSLHYSHRNAPSTTTTTTTTTTAAAAAAATAATTITTTTTTHTTA